MKLTKKRALEICRDLWKWLEENPDKTKDEWPEWKGNGGRIPDMQNFCPCCEYRMLTRKGFCSEGCLLWGCWESKVGHCMDDGSIFVKWLKARTKKTTKKYARKIWQACEKELKKL